MIFRGNPENFCGYAFGTIDQNGTGKLDFSEFMTAYALLRSGNLDTRLDLVRKKIFISINLNIFVASRYSLFVIMIVLERSVIEKSLNLLKL